MVALQVLLNSSHEIVCVVTQPDRKSGRGLPLSATPVKRLAQKSSLQLYQPENINANESVSFLTRLKPDIFVVIAYGQLLSPEILGIPAIMPLNAHASILPKYRGAAPINWAIINGDLTTGVSIMKIVQKMDAGPIIIQKALTIAAHDNALILEARLADLAAELLLEALSGIENKTYELNAQDESKATFAPKLKKEDGLIDWSRPASDIRNLIRGCLDWPGAYTYYKSRLLKLYRAEIGQPILGQASYKPGEVIESSKKGIVIATSRDSLVIQELQIEGSRKMTAEEFILGHKICPGHKLGKN